MSTTTNRGVAVWDGFKRELEGRGDEIAAILGRHIPVERFMATAIVAVKNMPQLLNADRRSLHNAVSRAAYDGLLPDGREGIIIPRKSHGKLLATWQPMTYGIRKRALELGGIIIDSAIVCSNDTLRWVQGDTPVLEHMPCPLDDDPGPMVGAYAIFRRDGVILHREIMRRSEILSVKAISRESDGLMWTTFEGEAWRKTVVRRGAKSVPAIDDKLRQIIERGQDEEFALDAASAKATPIKATIAAQLVADPDDAPNVDAIDGEAEAVADEPEPQPKAKATPSTSPKGKPVPELAARDEPQADAEPDALAQIIDAVPDPQWEDVGPNQIDPDTGELGADEPDVDAEPDDRDVIVADVMEAILRSKHASGLKEVWAQHEGQIRALDDARQKRLVEAYQSRLRAMSQPAGRGGRR